MRSKSFWNVNKKGQMSSSSSWSREHTRFSSIKDATIISIYIIFQNLATLGGSPLSLSLSCCYRFSSSTKLSRPNYVNIYNYLLRQERRGRRRLVSPVRFQLLRESVVSRQSVDSGFNQNQPKLGVHVLAVSLQVLAHRHGFLDQTV